MKETPTLRTVKRLDWGPLAKVGQWNAVAACRVRYEYLLL